MFEWRLRRPEASRGLKPVSTSDLNYEGRFLHIYWLCFSPSCAVKSGRSPAACVRLRVSWDVWKIVLKAPLFELTVTRLSLFWFRASPNWIYLAALYIERGSRTFSREGRCNYTILEAKNGGMFFIRRVRSPDLSSRLCLICWRLDWRQKSPGEKPKTRWWWLRDDRMSGFRWVTSKFVWTC